MRESRKRWEINHTPRAAAWRTEEGPPRGRPCWAAGGGARRPATTGRLRAPGPADGGPEPAGGGEARFGALPGRELRAGRAGARRVLSRRCRALRLQSPGGHLPSAGSRGGEGGEQHSRLQGPERMEYGPDMSGKERALDGRGGDATDAGARNRPMMARCDARNRRGTPPPSAPTFGAPPGPRRRRRTCRRSPPRAASALAGRGRGRGGGPADVLVELVEYHD